MKNYLSILLLLLGSVMLIQACKKDDNNDGESPPVYNPKYVSLNIPVFATTYLGNMQNPTSNPLTEEGIRLGRKLFYDKKLSNDGSMSCATCHKQENSFNDPRQFSQGTNGAFGSRNAMSIVNLGFAPYLFWDGRRTTLEDQAHDPVTNPIEMANSWDTVVNRLQMDNSYPLMFFYAFGTYTIDSLLVTKAVSQFERSMISFNSPFDRFFYDGDTTALDASQKRGYDLYFGDAECIHCHSGPLLTDNTLKNNGLDAVLQDLGYGNVSGLPGDNGKFKVPTLRNIAQSAPYMHDGRFATLDQVIEHYNSGVVSASPNLDPEMVHYTGGLNLTLQQKSDLLNFLNSFTDSQFILNTQFSNPN